MSDVEEKKYVTEVKSYFFKGLLWSIGTIIVIGITFYFTTTNTLANHSEKINKIEIKVNNLEEAMSAAVAEPQINNEQIKAITEMVQDIKARQIRSDERQDKMYDIMIDLAKKK